MAMEPTRQSAWEMFDECADMGLVRDEAWRLAPGPAQRAAEAVTAAQRSQRFEVFHVTPLPSLAFPADGTTIW